jgi:rRNA maturation endonuclease Nob1
MTWECVKCCNEFTQPKKPARCSECGGRLIAQDAMLSKASTATEAEIALWRLRQGA